MESKLTHYAKYTFDLHIHNSAPILISFEKDIPLRYCYNCLVSEINTETTIIDIFAEDRLSNKVLSLRTEDTMTIEDFVANNRNFFPTSPITKNLYTIFAIDKEYLTSLKVNHLI